MDIDDIIDMKKPVKKINCGVKGKSGERSIADILNKRFSSILEKNPSWGKFYRSVGSGNRGKQVSLSREAEEVFGGDVICKNFKYIIESKIGYDIDLTTIFDGENKQLNKFFEQANNDSIQCGKSPMLIWKKNRKPRIAFLKSLGENKELFNCRIECNGWTGVSLDELITKLPDDFFFSESKI